MTNKIWQDNRFCPLPRDEILYFSKLTAFEDDNLILFLSKLKVFADNKLNVAKMMISVSYLV